MQIKDWMKLSEDDAIAYLKYNKFNDKDWDKYNSYRISQQFPGMLQNFIIKDISRVPKKKEPLNLMPGTEFLKTMSLRDKGLIFRYLFKRLPDTKELKYMETYGVPKAFNLKPFQK